MIEGMPRGLGLLLLAGLATLCSTPLPARERSAEHAVISVADRNDTDRRLHKSRPRAAKRQRKVRSAAAKPQTAQPVPKGGRSSAVNTWSIFGFTEGSDTDAKGAKSVYTDVELRHAGSGQLSTIVSSTGLIYSPTDQLALLLSGLTDTLPSNAQSDPSIPQTPAANRVGISAGAKYQLFDRRQSAIGVAVQFLPYAMSGPNGSSGLGSEFSLLLDKELVSNAIFGAVNLSYHAESTETRGSGSETGLSLALTYRLSKDVFVGIETRALGASDGLVPRQANASAVYLGPTLYVSITDKAYFGVTWAEQIVGQGGGNLLATPDLANYEKRRILLKGGFSF